MRRTMLKVRLKVGVSTAMGPVLFLLASLYRRVWIPKCRIVVVVGSFGKSTTADMLARVLECPRGKGNNQPQVALAMLRLKRRHSRAVFEVGISRKRQMWALAVMLRPEVVVVTSIGSEHCEKLGSLAATAAEKVRMVEALGRGGLAVLNRDDPNVMWMQSRTCRRTCTDSRRGRRPAPSDTAYET